MKLAQKLIRAGSEHRKFLRQIFVSVDITAPLYYMSELDTYKIGVSRSSTSFMHKGMSKAFEIEDFEVGEEIAEIFTDEGDVVIDPVSGSGSTLQAAYELNRNAYGFEASRKFYIAAKENMPCFKEGN